MRSPPAYAAARNLAHGGPSGSRADRATSTPHLVPPQAIQHFHRYTFQIQPVLAEVMAVNILDGDHALSVADVAWRYQPRLNGWRWWQAQKNRDSHPLQLPTEQVQPNGCRAIRLIMSCPKPIGPALLIAVTLLMLLASA